MQKFCSFYNQEEEKKSMDTWMKELQDKLRDKNKALEVKFQL